MNYEKTFLMWEPTASFILRQLFWFALEVLSNEVVWEGFEEGNDNRKYRNTDDYLWCETRVTWSSCSCLYNSGALAAPNFGS